MLPLTKLKVSGLILFLFLYSNLIFPRSLNVDFTRYYEKYEQMSAQYKWVTPSLFEMIYLQSEAADLSVGVACAWIDAESGGNAKAVSKAGAIGLMQVLPATYEEIRKRVGYKNINKWDLLRPRHNLFIGFSILKYCLNRAHGNIILAAKYYNAGNSSYFNGPYIIKIITSLAASYPNSTVTEVIIASNGGEI